MRSEFRTTQLEVQHIVGIRKKVAMSEIGQTMGPLFGEVHGYIQQSGEKTAGMPLAIYHSMSGPTVDLECAIPVVSAMTGAGRVRGGELPAGTAASVTHVGPYDDLPQTWAALTEWMKTQGLEASGTPWEVYVTDPGAEPDSSKWRTDIFFPVR